MYDPLLPSEKPISLGHAKLVIGSCMMAHYYMQCSIFSYAAFLVVDRGWVDNLSDAGNIAGLLGSAVFLGRTLASGLWGIAADRYGRRFVVLVGMASLILGNLLFGIARELWSTLLARALLLGAGNGYISVSGLLCHEMGGEAHERDLLAFLFSVGSITSIFGPTLAAFCYGQLVSQTPALLPSLVGAGLAASAFSITYALCPETRRRCSSATTRTNVAVGTIPDDATRITVNSHTASWRALFGRRLRMLVLVRGLNSMLLIGMCEAIPILVVARLRLGGYGLHQKQVGALLAIVGSAQCAFTSLLMARAIGLFRLPTTLVVCNSLSALVCVLFPIAHAILSTSVPAHASLACLAPLMFAFNAAGFSVTTATTAGINQIIAMHYQPNAGALNGNLAMTDSLAKSIGPALLPPIFALGLRTHMLGPEGPTAVPMVWLIVAVLIVLIAYISAHVADLGDQEMSENTSHRQLNVEVVLQDHGTTSGWSSLFRLKRIARRLRDRKQLQLIEDSLLVLSSEGSNVSGVA